MNPNLHPEQGWSFEGLDLPLTEEGDYLELSIASVNSGNKDTAVLCLPGLESAST